MRGLFHKNESNYLRQSLQVHPWVPYGVGNGTTVRSVRARWISQGFRLRLRQLGQI